MATSQGTPKRPSSFSRMQTVPGADKMTRKLSGLTGSESSTPNPTPVKKKLRLQKADEILKELAKNALEEMESRGLRDHEKRDENEPPWDSRIGDRYDYILSGSSQEEEDELEVPLSPLTFLNRIGLKEARKRRHDRVAFRPPFRPPIIDAGLKGCGQFSDPSSCTTPESGSSRRRPKRSLGEVTPATARAAQSLLDLTR